MSGSYNKPTNDYGELMACLMRERARYESEEEFKAFAVESVRRFISDLRGLSIEISMRPHYLETPSYYGAPQKVTN
jgi:hypothetical protein